VCPARVLRSQSRQASFCAYLHQPRTREAAFCLPATPSPQVYMDADLMKTYFGKESPPPGSYNVQSAVGKQVRGLRGACQE
jgi:hypothetical protein